MSAVRPWGILRCRSTLNATSNRQVCPRRGLQTTRRVARLKAGLVGLPNVGKSSLYNSLVQSGAAAEVANYPFCTIHAQQGAAMVEDSRLETLAVLAGSKRQVAATFEIVDIAGLIAGASKGEGLGNQFLANIRECTLLLHVVRCFDDVNVTHVTGTVNPTQDVDIIDTELILADMERLDKAMGRKRGPARTMEELGLLEEAMAVLNSGRNVRSAWMASELPLALESVQLLTSKPVIYVLNVADNELLGQPSNLTRAFMDTVRSQGDDCVLVSAQLDAELARLPADERSAFLTDLGLSEAKLGRRALTTQAYAKLNNQTFFTSGPEETRAWTIRRGTKAPQAAGKIHGDLERGFICADIVGYDQMVACQGNLAQAKAQGLLRQEGKDYVMQDGDVAVFRFNKTK